MSEQPQLPHGIRLTHSSNGEVSNAVGFFGAFKPQAAATKTDAAEPKPPSKRRSAGKQRHPDGRDAEQGGIVRPLV